MKNWSENERKHTQALQIAKDLLESIKCCDLDGDSDDHLKIKLADSILDQAAYGTRDIRKIIGDDEFRVNAYFNKYEQNSIFTSYSEQWFERVDYIKAKLQGIVEGNIKTGDGHLGEEITTFTYRMKTLLEEQQSKMSPQVFKLYQSFFNEMQQTILSGARLGLFSSGNPLPKQRSQEK